jgi:CheY-like chemotaxis protein
MTYVAVLADDLIWQTRLVDAVAATGATTGRAKTGPELDRALACADALVVDLTARNYDPIAAIRRATELRPGIRVLAVGQHDDVGQRKRAVAAGAERVLAYRKLFEDGPGTIERWLARPVAASGTAR